MNSPSTSSRAASASRRCSLGRVAPLRRQLARRLRPPARPRARLASRRRTNSSVIWLAAVLTNVPGPVHDLRRLQLRDLAAGAAAGSRSASVGTLPDRQPSSRISRPQVGGQHRPLEVALDQHDDRLVAEVLLEALGGLEGVRARVRRASRWRRSARAAAPARAPPSASTATATSATRGRRATARTIRSEPISPSQHGLRLR